MTILKYNSSGTQQWVAHYDSSGYYDGAVAIYLNSTGTRLSATGFSGSAFTNWDFVTLGINMSTGSIGTIARNANPNGGISKPVALTQDFDGNWYVLGATALSPTNSDIKLIKYDTLFNEVWVRTFGSADSLADEPAAITVNPHHRLCITGFTSRSNGATDMLTLAYDKNGNLLWNRSISSTNPSKDAKGRDIKAEATFDGHLYVTGKLDKGSNHDYVTASYTQDGDLRWLKMFDDTTGSDDKAIDIALDAANNPIVSGICVRDTNTKYVSVKYEQWSRTNAFAMDTDTIPIFVRKNIILRFDTSVLNFATVNNRDKIYGTIDDFIRPPFADTLKVKLHSIFQRDYFFVKLAPNYQTTDTFLISNIGDTIPIPPFWSSFLLVYNIGDSSETCYADSLQKLFPYIHYAHLNYCFSNATCTGACASVAPNDDYYCNNQFALHDDDANNFEYGHINAEGAWALETGRSFVKVGVFDTPVYWEHEDFQKYAWASKVIGGYDYGYSNAPLYALDDSAYYDSHGTKVAGIIGALRNNGKGVAGVAGGTWCANPPEADPSEDKAGVSLYSYGVGQPGVQGKSSLVLSALINALNDALSNDPFINYSNVTLNNMSLTCNSNEVYFPEFKEKSYYAFLLGKITVVSRGNIESKGNQVLFPACFPDDWVVSVGGSHTDGSRHFKSMFGHGMDVIAPFTTSMNFTTNLGNSYAVADGTSASAPNVSGIAGLLLSYMNNPNGQPDYNNLAPEDVEEIIQRTAWFDTIHGYSPPYDPEIGYGRVDAGAALNMVNKNFSRLLHFDSHAHSATNTKTKVTTSDILVKLTDPIPNTNIIKGTYKAEVWKIETTVYHNISLLPNETIQAFWARSGASESFPHFDSTGSNYFLSPYVKSYVNEFPLPDTNSATLCGYYYKLKDSATSTTIGWFPHDTTGLPKMSYTIYTRSTTPVSANSVDEKLAVSIYPNPANDMVHISLKADMEEYCTVKLYNHLGQTVATIFSGKVSSLSENYRTDHLSPGIYYIHVDFGNKSEGFKLLILK
ncbi:MAG: S8 family peptidase [Chitinophagales bacterium]|nr:S8 family peptidase [Chitinophagales bacterium]